MLEKEVIRSSYSNKVLINPDGTYEIQILEDILYDSTSNREIDKNPLIVVTRCQRVQDFDPNHPAWEDIQFNLSLQELFEMYKEVKNIEYKRPDCDLYDYLKSRYNPEFRWG